MTALLTGLLFLCLIPQNTQAQCMIGEVRMFAGDFAPRDWALCDGQLLAISSNPALFSILGTQYGGNGSTNFALPDFQGRAPAGTGNGSGLTALANGQKRGVEQVTLSTTQLPSHTHTVSTTVNTASVPTSASPDGQYPAPIAGRTISTPPANIQASAFGNAKTGTMASDMVQTTIGNTGGGQSVYTQSPINGINFIICTNGIFPPR